MYPIWLLFNTRSKYIIFTLELKKCELISNKEGHHGKNHVKIRQNIAKLIFSA